MPDPRAARRLDEHDRDPSHCRLGARLGQVLEHLGVQAGPGLPTLGQPTLGFPGDVQVGIQVVRG